MLIIYRTNPGFEGQIQKLERDLRPVEMDAYLATPEGQKACLAYIDVGDLSDADLVNLASGKSECTVDTKTKILQKGGKAAELVPVVPLKDRVAALESKVATEAPIEKLAS